MTAPLRDWGQRHHAILREMHQTFHDFGAAVLAYAESAEPLYLEVIRATGVSLANDADAAMALPSPPDKVVADMLSEAIGSCEGLARMTDQDQMQFAALKRKVLSVMPKYRRFFDELLVARGIPPFGLDGFSDERVVRPDVTRPR